jgi:adenylate cyclase class 2
LIAYRRATGAAGRTCTYTVIRVPDPAACRAGLAAVLGVRVEVRKVREKWRLGATILHLDDVDGLGSFVELETPFVRPGDHWRRLDLVGLDRADDVGTSYADLLARR